MKATEYKIKIRGLKTGEGSIPLTALREICDSFLKGSDRVLRLCVEGDSAKPGKSPEWLKRSLDITVTGLKPGSTVIELNAPVLGETIPEVFAQKTLWEEPFNQEDTALTLLSRSLSDVVTENMESDYLDAGVLDALLAFQPIIKNYASEIELTPQGPGNGGFKISGNEIKKIRKLKLETPKPKTVVIAGHFNLIEHAGLRFQLIPQEDKKIQGVMNPALINVEDMRALWGKRVTIKGKAHYKPSGKFRHIEAEEIRPFVEGDEIFRRIPEGQRTLKGFETYIQEHSIGKTLKKVWGKWPGDESIESLLSALEGRVS